MESELINILNNLYSKYGNTDEVLKLSRLVDNLVVKKQKTIFQDYIHMTN